MPLPAPSEDSPLIPEPAETEPQLLVAEDHATVKRADAEAKVLIAAGYAIVWTPVIALVLSFASSAFGFDLRVDHELMRYCIAAGATVTGYFFGKGIYKAFFGGKS